MSLQEAEISAAIFCIIQLLSAFGHYKMKKHSGNTKLISWFLITCKNAKLKKIKVNNRGLNLLWMLAKKNIPSSTAIWVVLFGRN